MISVVQGTELSVQPLGVGVTLTPGQMLDPLNDLVERFSDLMLAASVAFGVQLLLLEMGAHWGMSLALTLVALAWAWPYIKRKQSPALLTRVLVALLLVRFIVPAAGMASDVVYRGFMQAQYAAGQQGIEQASQAIGALAPPTALPTRNGGSSTGTSSSSATPSTRLSSTPSASSSSSCCRP